MSSGKLLLVNLQFSSLERGEGCGALRIASIEKGNTLLLAFLPFMLSVRELLRRIVFFSLYLHIEKFLPKEVKIAQVLDLYLESTVANFPTVNL